MEVILLPDKGLISGVTSVTDHIIAQPSHAYQKVTEPFIDNLLIVSSARTYEFYQISRLEVVDLIFSPPLHFDGEEEAWGDAALYGWKRMCHQFWLVFRRKVP